MELEPSSQYPSENGNFNNNGKKLTKNSWWTLPCKAYYAGILKFV